MPNKHFCQGPHCHTNPTTDRFLKSKGIIRGRYAVLDLDRETDWHARAKYFCSTRCESDWLNVNMDNIRQNIPVTFIRHRRITEGYEKVTEESRYGHRYTSIKKIGVDNNAD
jgi:hypothetical protein